ncbi:MAG: helix-turn-helix domain-containing protein, partial [Candidatus Omnitrophica bacterium]|nr:helix-turn-helix domain-containing protein [Candidatus Omnitrophota bacterium]
ASDGTEALNLLKRANEIGVVILDVKMPGLSGTDVLSEIKKIDPSLGIIILTGYSSKDVAIDALKGHADDYAEKPIDINKIKETIERLLAKRRGQSEISASDTKGKMEKVRHFIERNCFKKTTLKDAAESVCLSPKYLSRIFKEATGTGFNDYRLKIKIEAAKELLDKSGYNVNQISDKLGYENTESFIRQFKKITHHTPTEFRRKIRKKKVSASKAKANPKNSRRKRH